MGRAVQGSESEDVDSSMRPENAMAAFCCGPRLKRLLRYCGCTQVELEVNMEASIKGGSAFEELYRGEDVAGGDESFQSATGQQSDMDTSRSFSQWAIGRIGHDLELGCSVGASTHDESSTAPSTPAPASPSMGPDAAPAPAAGAGLPRPAVLGHVLAADGVSPVGFRKRVAILPDGTKPPGTPVKAAPSAAPPSPTLKLPIPIPPGRKIHWNEIGEGGFTDMKYLGSYAAAPSEHATAARQPQLRHHQPNATASARRACALTMRDARWCLAQGRVLFRLLFDHRRRQQHRDQDAPAKQALLHLRRSRPRV